MIDKTMKSKIANSVINAGVVLAVYQHSIGDHDFETSFQDLLTDLMHLAHKKGHDFMGAIDRAQYQFSKEIAGG